MSGRDGKEDFFFHQKDILIICVIFLSQGEKSNIQIVVFNHLLKFIDVFFHRFHHNVRVGLPECRIDGGEHIDTPSGSKANGKASPPGGGNIADLIVGILFQTQDLTGIAQIDFTGFCGSPVDSGPVKQRCAQLFFQL